MFKKHNLYEEYCEYSSDYYNYVFKEWCKIIILIKKFKKIKEFWLNVKILFYFIKNTSYHNIIE